MWPRPACLVSFPLCTRHVPGESHIANFQSILLPRASNNASDPLGAAFEFTSAQTGDFPGSREWRWLVHKARGVPHPVWSAMNNGSQPKRQGSNSQNLIQVGRLLVKPFERAEKRTSPIGGCCNPEWMRASGVGRAIFVSPSNVVLCLI